MEFIFLFFIGAIGIYIFVRNDEVNSNRRKWEDWRIKSYQITLRYDARSLNLDGEVLGDATTLTVTDSEIVNVFGTYAETTGVEEYERFTVEGLFDQIIYYATVQYDSVYGFPTRLGDTHHWVIEVISFELLN